MSSRCPQQDTSTSHYLTGRTQSPPTSSSIVLAVSSTSVSVLREAITKHNTGDLEIEGIIERAPSPVPLIDRDPDDLTPDELREQNRLLRQSRPSVKVKKEFKREKRARQRSATLSDDDEGDVTIMSENNKRRRTRASMENAEVIDLSD